MKAFTVARETWPVSARLSKKTPRWVKQREEKTWSSCNHSGSCHVVPVFNKLPRESGYPSWSPTFGSPSVFTHSRMSQKLSAFVSLTHHSC